MSGTLGILISSLRFINWDLSEWTMSPDPRHQQHIRRYVLSPFQTTLPHRPPHPISSQDTAQSDITRLFASRIRSEEEALSHTLAPNHLYASSLHALLDARKSPDIKSQKDLDDLSRKWNIEPSKMERLAKVVNSPSVDGRLTTKFVDRNGDVKMTYTVRPQGSPFAWWSADTLSLCSRLHG